ncbi:glutamyl-tRNA(Gln) amidotransferase subunit C [Tepidicaulis marinus]|jgi:aspartyl-tRNA(Asn)/glutamyl-tRNA(Gln) amidotransferase subunit C|uniref:Aspartyl/glutamyl-tRNA(Asn/Gln) amidotransferase subunit C n=1 Tax=Tepidicaulis marinus TaxID=1333998 RepID=A0A081B817_9HYPH|nr:Asp-tRNA(Asn)/Glu-tRNA(Gln) amidotransferase subunit GatC [Tepidicaulis marinus]GAK44185.1 glutamyl-tRNA(Gln) amidotransferase subunit C [Tepidicaulis marinus]
MSVDQNTVRHIARLARIAVTDEEVAPLAKELSSILDWVEQLGEVNTDNVEPMASVENLALPMREDVVTDGNIQDQVTKNAPGADDGFFAVPKVVE